MLDLISVFFFISLGVMMVLYVIGIAMMCRDKRKKRIKKTTRRAV